jgi:WD40 repeat protein
VKPKFKSKRSKWPIFRNFHSKPKLAVLIEALGYTPSKTTQFGDIVQDAKRFILYNGSIIEKAPLQVYASALVFSPQTSLIRQQFLGQHPMWIDNWPSIEENWSPSLQTLEGHSGSATAVVFSPDGQLLASASHDWRVRLWNAKTGALLRTLKGHSGWVTAVAFSPDGQLLASASHDRTVILWDAKTGALQRMLKGHFDWVAAVAFSPDGQLLASASRNRTIILWDANAGALQHTRSLEGHSRWVTAVAFSPDGQLLASASHDQTVRLWDAKAGAFQRTLKGHSDWVTAVAFSPDGQLLASASGDKTVRLWDAKAGVLQRTLEVGSISSLSFSIDGSRLETNKGPIKLGITPPDPSPSILWSQSLYSLNDDKSWVMWNGHNILWLPPEYRPTCEKVQDNILAMGHASGRVTIAQFNPDTIYLAKEVWVI